MVEHSRSSTAAQRERLLYTLMLRQIETQSSVLRAAYGRLERAISDARDASPDTLILDWLEAELTRLRRQGSSADEAGAHLLNQAVALCRTLNG